MKHLMTLIPVLAVSVPVFAIDWPTGTSDIVLGSDAARLETGSAVAPEGASVHSLSVYPAKDATITVGGGPLALESGAVVSNACSSGELVLAANATGTDGLRFEAAAPVTVEVAGLSFVTDSDSTVRSNMILDDYEIVSAVSCGTDMGAHDLKPCCVVRTPGCCAVQFQAADGTYLKCVKLILSQIGANVVGRAVYARYTRQCDGYGHDFDISYEGGASVAKGDGWGGYGVKAITFRLKDLPTRGALRVNGAVAANGPVVVGSSASVVFEGAALGLQASAIRVDGLLEIGDRMASADRTLSTAFSGTGGTLAFGPFEDSAQDEVVIADPVSYTDNEAKLISADMCVSDIAGFKDIRIANEAGQAFFPTWSNGKLTVQFQAFKAQKGTHGDKIPHDGYTMGFVMTFAQTVNGLTAKRESGTYYLWGYPSDVGTDLTKTHTAKNGQYNLGGYTVVGIGRTLVKLTGVNTMADGTIVIRSNAQVRVQSAGILPDRTMTGVEIHDGGILEVSASGGAKGIYPIRVKKGGILRSLVAGEVFSYGEDERVKSTTVVLEGGTLDLTAGGSIADDGCTYINRLQMQDGAHIRGCKVRVGTPSTTWYVCGTSPSYLESGCLMVGKKNSYTFTLDVADVTKNSDVDLYQTGALRDYNSTHYGIVCKKGGGTWLLGTACSGFCGEVRVEAGTLCLGCSNAFPDVGSHATASIPAFTLKGGTLAVASDTENAISNLTLQADSAISLASGAMLAFGDTSAMTWTAEKRLVVSGLDEGTLRFGTSAAGLTENQVKAIRVLKNDRLHKAVLDENGYLRQVDSGLMILFR